MTLFGRAAVVTVDDLDLSDFDLEFEVTRNVGREPNTAEIRVFNLAEATRSKLAQAGDDIFCTLAAGYGADLVQLFFGNLRTANSLLEGADWITTISTGDGERARRRKRLRRQFGPGTKLNQVLQDLAAELGVGIGNTAGAVSGVSFDNGSDEFTHGTVVDGNASDEFTNLLRSCGLEWSIQDNEIQILPVGEARPGTAVLLTEDTGLIGSPEVGSKEIVRAQALIQPGLTPGGLVQIKSRLVDTTAKILRVDYTGATGGGEAWFATMECKQVAA